MTYEEALKFANEKILAYDSEMADFLEVCKEALKKQIQKKPIKDYRYRPKICPFCHDFLECYQSFCDNCGQRIDWSDENDI